MRVSPSDPKAIWPVVLATDGVHEHVAAAFVAQTIEECAADLDTALRRHELPAARFTCEITETVAMEDTATSRAAKVRRGAATGVGATGDHNAPST